VLTPGTVVEDAYLEPSRPNYLVAAWSKGLEAGIAAQAIPEQRQLLISVGHADWDFEKSFQLLDSLLALTGSSTKSQHACIGCSGGEACDFFRGLGLQILQQIPLIAVRDN